MTIHSLRIAQFRNLSALELNPSPSGLNVICGNNGSGKTSILEAIHYLSLGRSFRSSQGNRLIMHEESKFSLFSQIVSESGRLLGAGIERQRNGATRMRLNEKDISSIAELAALLPIRLINSQTHHIFESGPIHRRQYVDWGLFYHTQHFMPCWQQYERTLKQRNAVLREGKSRRELDSWSNRLVEYGLELDRLRREYVQALAPIAQEIAQLLLPLPNLTFHYQPGWDDTQDFASALHANYLDELRAGYTLQGPHRADLDICADGLLVKHFLSRGQQKLLICAIIIAQGILLTAHANKGLIYLVDDLPAELDLNGRQRLISLLTQQKAQIFVTAIEHDAICSVIEVADAPVNVFHVEQMNSGSR